MIEGEVGFRLVKGKEASHRVYEFDRLGQALLFSWR